MLSLSSHLVRRRVLHSFGVNCIKRLQTNANKLERTLQSRPNAGLGFNRNLELLETSLRRLGRITANDLKQCINELSKSKSIRPTTTQSLLLIRSCGALASDETPESRKNLCQALFEKLSEVTDLDISHYNQLLRVFVENEFDFDAINFLEKMQSKGVEPNRVTFMLIIDWFCQKRNLSEAIKILEHMKSKDMAITESVFNSLIIGYGKTGDLETAEQTMDLMRSSGAEPSSDTYTALLCAYAFNSKNPEIAQKIDKVIEEINKSETELSERQLFKVVKTLALNDSNIELIDKILNQIDKSLNYNKECLNVINELMFANKVDAGLKLYQTMGVSERQMREKTMGNGLIRSMVRANVDSQRVISVCEKLRSEYGNENAIKIATEWALLHSDINTCRTYLKKMAEDGNPMRLHYFYPLIVKSENEDQILDVLSTDLISFVGSSYSQLIELFVDYVWPKNILDVHTFMDKCKDIGFSLTVTYNSLIRYYLSNDRLNDAIQLLNSPIYSTLNLIRRDIISELAESAFKTGTKIDDITKVLRIVHSRQRPQTEGLSDTYGQYLLSLIRKGISQNLMNRFLESFDKMSVKLSEVSANAIRDRIQLSEENETLLTKLTARTADDLRGLTYHDIDDITKPRREMTPEELEGNLIELRSKGLNTRGVLRSLLMAYCRRTKFSDDDRHDPLVTEARKRVFQILDELKESDFQFSNAMYAMLMDFFVNCGDVESALDMKSKISEDFEIDWYKIINLATLYVKNGEIQKGLDLIRNENKRKADTVDGEEVNMTLTRSRDMTIYRFLNSLIEANADINVIKEAFDLCVNYSSLAPTSVMAGPLVKYYIMKGDYSGALNQFSECVDKYRITPWKSQLIKHFLESGDQQSLQKVLDHSNNVHGQMNTIMELAAYCVEVGKVKQAKKLLDTPGLRVRQPKIDNICEQLVKEDKIDALEQLIRLSRNVFDVNRDRMLYHLIRGCIKLQNTEKALNCWTLLQEENIQPSDNTLILLANFLQQNNITVPFAVPPQPIKKEFKPERSEEQTPSKDDSLHKFNAALKTSDLDEALRIKNSIESEGKSLLMSQNCSLIEALLNADRIDEAFDISKKLLSSKLFPSPRIMRYLNMKLSSTGDYRRLEELRPLMPEFLAQNNSFSNSLAIAYVNSGKAEELIDKLSQFKPFPLGAFLKALETRPDLEERLIGVANQMVSESEYHLPLNMVWIHFLNKGRFEDAKKIYNSCPKFKDFLLFSSVLDLIRANNDIVLAKNLVEAVSQSNLTPKSVGVTYSALIEAYIDSGDIKSAEDVVVNEVLPSKPRVDPKTGQEVKLGVEHLNRSTLKKLINSIRDKEQREPKFSINGQTMSASSSDSDVSDSSDEEVVDIKTRNK